MSETVSFSLPGLDAFGVCPSPFYDAGTCRALWRGSGESRHPASRDKGLSGRAWPPASAVPAAVFRRCPESRGQLLPSPVCSEFASELDV